MPMGASEHAVCPTLHVRFTFLAAVLVGQHMHGNGKEDHTHEEDDENEQEAKKEEAGKHEDNQVRANFLRQRQNKRLFFGQLPHC